MPLAAFTPSQLMEKFQTRRDEIDAKDFFSRPSNKKLQEFWCAARFGAGVESLGQTCLLLVSEQDDQTDADFEMQVAGISHRFQITEVQSAGRRRGDEYKGKSEGPWRDADWKLGTEHGPEWIKAAIERKTQRYASTDDLHLLVYVNFPARDQKYIDLKPFLQSTVQGFASVWLLASHHMCCVKPCPTLASPDGWLLLRS